ncbi:MAG: LptF/LptG family permease [Candidatus Riflebacteria bacterium]|nr:LptF/LptG family permease [Candidatus Riflebacteria bacterium]
MLGALVIVTFGNFLKAISLAFEGRVEGAIILEWFIKRTPEDMQYIFPVATLLATLLVFSQMSRTQEIVALRSAGVSPWRLMAPVVLFAALVTAGVFHFLERIVPPSMRRSQELWEKKIRVNRALSSFKENVLLRGATNRLVFVGRFNLITYEIEYLKIRDNRERT